MGSVAAAGQRLLIDSGIFMILGVAVIPSFRRQQGNMQRYGYGFLTWRLLSLLILVMSLLIYVISNGPGSK
jgi:hypothetical protein